jgi:TRAP transporter T-component
MKRPGFAAARKNDDTIKAWLSAFDDPAHDAPNLFWTGYAWVSKANVVKEDPAIVGELFVGVAMVERAVALDEKYLYGSGHIVLGAYHARTAMAELDEAKKHFNRALQINGRKYLLAQAMFASKFYCIKGEREPYEKLLNEVLAAGDVLPAARVYNTIAKRRAKRYLGKERLKSCGL